MFCIILFSKGRIISILVIFTGGSMKTKILAVILAAVLCVSFSACDSMKKALDRTDKVFDRANTGKTTDTEKSTVTDIARPTDVDTQTDIDPVMSSSGSVSSAISVDTETGTDTELVETELEDTELDDNSGDIQPQAVELAGYTLTAERIDIDKDFNASSGDRITGEMTGDTLYILDRNKLYGYFISGTNAEKSSETRLSADYTKIDADSTGTVYLSADDLSAAYLAGDGNIYETEVSGKLALSDTSDFGLVYSKNSDNVLRYSQGNTENWTLTNLFDDKTRTGDFNMISNIEIVGDRVFVTGSSAEENNARKLGVYGTDGELILLSDDKSSGTGIISITDTPTGYMACSHGTLSLWNYDGSLAGITTSGSLSQLFGVRSTVTLDRLFSLNDGAVLALCTEESDGKTKPVLYRIMGY